MRFVVIGDTHFFAPGRGKDGIYWNRTLQSRSAEIGAAVVASVSSLQPEFVIHCGDLTGRCDLENFAMGRQVMDRLGCPWYLIPGNHDTWYPGVRDALSDLFSLPRGQCYYTFSRGEIGFVFLDTCYWQARDGSISPYLDKVLYDAGMIDGLAVPRTEIDWLENVLERYSDKKVILVSHAPLGFKKTYPAKETPIGLANRDELRSLMSRFPNVILALAGHWHINDVYVENGTVFCQTSSLREYPFEFRMVEVGDDGLSITTHGLNDSAFQQASLIPEKGNDWIAGTPTDRNYVIKWQSKLMM